MIGSVVLKEALNQLINRDVVLGETKLISGNLHLGVLQR
jgi:hypothetical protein